MWSHLADSRMYALTVAAAPPLVVGALLGLLGWIVVLRERASRVSLAFTAMTSCAALWLFSVGLSFSSLSPGLAWRWNRIEHFGVMFIPSTIFVFAVVILHRWQRWRWWAIASLTVSGMFYLSILFTPWLITGLYQYPWGYYAQYGRLSGPFLVFFFLLLAVSLRLFWHASRQTFRITERRRLRALMTAFAIGYLGAVDFLPTYGVALYPFGYVPVFIFLVLVAQAIWRYRLADLTPAFAAQQIARTMPDALFVLDQDGVVQVANPAASQLFGRTRDRLVGHSLLHLNQRLLPPETRRRLLHAEGVERYEVDYFAPGRGPATLEVTASTLPDRARQPVGIVYIARDVTERKALEHQLIQAQKFELIGQLAAGVAHEINTPIQAVSCNASFLQDNFSDLGRLLDAYARLLSAAKQGRLNPGLVAEVEDLTSQVDVEYLRREIPQAIRQSCEGLERVATIVRSMRDLSHHGQEHQTPTDLRRACEDALAIARPEWQEVVEVVTEFDAALPPVPCVEHEIHQVILNLLINAFQAVSEQVRCHPEQGKGTITVRTRQADAWAELEVCDTGNGMPDAVRAKVFEPFFTTKPVGLGTGQGLAIARSIVERHGGTITFETQEGRGTTFTVRLPLEVSDAPRSAVR